jgi:chromate reductase
MVSFRARVLPGPEVMVADASNAFGPDGQLKDERYVRALAELMALLRAEAGRPV